MAFARSDSISSKYHLGDDISVCAICFEKYKQPKVLPCLHTFCVDCLRRHYDAHRLTNGGRLSCPSCREMLVMPEEGVTGFWSDGAVHKAHDLIEQLTKTVMKTDTDSDTGVDGEKQPLLSQGDATGGIKNPGVKNSEITARPSGGEQEMKATNERLQSELSRIRKRLLSIYTIEQHVRDNVRQQVSQAMNNKDRVGAAAHVDRHRLKQRIEGKQSGLLRELGLEQEKLYSAASQLRSLCQVLSEVIDRGEPSLISAYSTVLSPYLQQVDGVLKQASIAAGQNGSDYLLDRFQASAAASNASPPALGTLWEPKDNSMRRKIFGKRKSKTTELVKSSSPMKKKNDIPGLAQPKLLMRIRGHGSEPGKFDFPVHAVFSPAGQILVCDKNNHRMQLFDSVSGALEREFLIGQVKPLRARVSSKDGCLYISDELTTAVKVYAPDGTLINRIGESFFQHPAGIDFDVKGNLVMCDQDNNYIITYSPDGTELNKFFFRFKEDRVCPIPYALCTNKDDDQIIVSDPRNNLVKVFKGNGRRLFTIRKLTYPRGVAVDPCGNILISEGDAHRITMYSPQGKFIREVLGKRDGLCFPLSVESNDEGQLLVTQCGYTTPHEVLLYQIY